MLTVPSFLAFLKIPLPKKGPTKGGMGAIGSLICGKKGLLSQQNTAYFPKKAVPCAQYLA